MSHHHKHNQHIQPMVRKKPNSGGRLPSTHFGALVGKFDHWTLNTHNSDHPNPNHVFVWLRVEGQTTANYEAAINVLSKTTPGAGAELQVASVDEAVEKDHWPAQGFDGNAKLSYVGLGLKQADFRTASESELRDLIESYASNAELIKILGVTYSGGDGIHDVHMNSGNTDGHANHPNQDGAVAFYFNDASGPVARWVFLKFSTEELA